MNGHKDLKTLKEEETKLFGGTTGDSGQRSNVLIRVECEDFVTSSQSFNQQFQTYEGNAKRHSGKAFPTNAMYYLGYGPANWVKEAKETRFIRHYITVGTNFNVIIKVKEKSKDEILKTFQVVEQFGGIGSKSRNAFGCFRIKKCSINEDSIKLQPIKLRDFGGKNLADYTSFSNKISVFETQKTDYNSWDEAFKSLCVAYQYARENVEYWHNWAIRELIALPIVVKGEREIEDNFLQRHSKPYFMHVTKTPEGYKGEIVLIPYNYLSNCPEIPIEKFENKRADYFDSLCRFNNLLKTKLQTTIENSLQ